MQRNKTLKRMLAYLIDLIIITLISTSLTNLKFLNPNYAKYNELANTYNETLSSYYKGDIDVKKLSTQINNLNYDLNKNGSVYIISEVIIIFLYFGVFNAVTNGQTLGKKIMGLKIISVKNSTVKIYEYFIRTLILNGVINKLVILIALNFPRNIYLKISNITSNLISVLMLAIFIMVIVRNDNRGVHDLLANTQVIDIKEEKNIIKNKEEEN